MNVDVSWGVLQNVMLFSGIEVNKNATTDKMFINVKIGLTLQNELKYDTTNTKLWTTFAGHI